MISSGKSLIFLCFLVVLSACNRQEQAAVPDFPRLTPKVRMQDVTFHSSALDRDMHYRVILPASIPPKQKLRAVYLLHGNGGNSRDWSNYSDVAQFAEKQLLLVMPEGGSSWYTNAVEHPQDRYEDYIVSDLISDVESRFPVGTGRQDRAIVGVSMGGFGAVKLALKHPELFSYAAGISSALDVPSRPFSFKRISQWSAHESVFGPWKSQTRQENDPFVLARSADPAKVPYLFLTCGEQEGLLAPNRKFAALLEQRHFQFEFHTVPGGHDWRKWNEALPDVFQSLLDHIGP